MSLITSFPERNTVTAAVKSNLLAYVLQFELFVPSTAMECVRRGEYMFNALGCDMDGRNARQARLILRYTPKQELKARVGWLGAFNNSSRHGVHT